MSPYENHPRTQVFNESLKDMLTFLSKFDKTKEYCSDVFVGFIRRIPLPPDRLWVWASKREEKGDIRTWALSEC